MKKTWKRILSMFLAFVMVFGMLPVNAFANKTEPGITEETSVTEPAAAEAEAPATEETAVPVTEAPVAETTVPETEAPAAETTVPETEAPVVETTVPETEAPVVETTVPETEASVVETTVPETEAPAEKPENSADTPVSDSPADTVADASPEPEETETEETQPEVARPVRADRPLVPVTSGEDFPDNDTLFAGYAEHIWFGTDISMFGTRGRDQLDYDTQRIYDALVPYLKQIANGQRESAIIKVGTSLLTGDPAYDAYFTADVELEFHDEDVDFTALHEALLADLPFEMYWYDKTAGYLPDVWYFEEGDPVLCFFYFSVASQYHDGNLTEIVDPFSGEPYADPMYCTVDPDHINAVMDAAETAQAVVDSVANDPNVKTDYDKLLAYKDWICENTSYNEDVKTDNLTFSENINPWQLIYVFDNDPSTAVVCEGYSKAFQYLCELTFSEPDPADETVTCYSVTGTLAGEGAHMWNIVELEGNHYLVDVTNSDENTVGEDGSLFLAGAAPDGSAGTFTFDTKGTSTTTFIYDEDTIELWGDSGILTLSETYYEPVVEEEPEVPEESEPSDEMTQEEFEAFLAENAGTNFDLPQSVTITEDMTINTTTPESPYDNSIRIVEGVTLTVANGAALNLESNFIIDGGTVVVEEGSTLVAGTSENSRCMLYVWGGTLDVAEESDLDLTYGRIMVKHGSDYSIPGWITDDSISAQAYIRNPAQLHSTLALTQYANIDIYVQCDLTVTEDITVAANQFLCVQYPYSMTVNEGVTVTVKPWGTLFNTVDAVINNNGRILCSGSFQNSGILNGNPVEFVKETLDDAAFLEAMANAEHGFLMLSADISISGNVEIPGNVTVYLDNGSTLTVNEGATLTVNGQLSTNNGSITIDGTLIKNGWMHTDNLRHSDSSSCQITISETGTFRNNSGMFLGSGTLTIDGTYISGEHSYVAYDDTKAVINGIEKIDRVQLQIIARTEDELISALEKRDDVVHHSVYVDEDITLNDDLTIPEDVSVTVCYSWGEESDWKTLTIPEGVTLTVNGSLGVAPHGEVILEAGAAIVNNGWFGLDGRLVKKGTVTGNEIEIFGGTIVSPDMSQAEFAAAVAAAAENGETYELNSDVTLTEDLVIASNVNIGQFGSLTVADGAELTIRNTYNDEFAQVMVLSGGAMTIQSGAALTIESMMQVAGMLTVEDGAAVNAHDDCIWINVTDGGIIDGIAYSRLGATYGVETAEEMEAAYNDTDTYAATHVYINENITLDRDITIPEGDTLTEMLDIAVKVPAGYALTNNGTIDIQNNNRLEVLIDGTLVNNGTINVSDYAQLVIRGNLTDNGQINGTIVWGEMSHEDLMAAMAQCAATESNWIHESITTLDPNFNEGFLRTSDLGLREGGEIANELHLVEGGTLIVPAGCTLEISNPLVVEEGGKLIIEEGGKLVVNGMLAVLNGTVYIAGEFDQLEDSIIDGRLTFAGETDPWLSETWLDNWEEGWFLNPDNEIHEAGGLHVMDSHWRIFFLNTWDAENLQWNRVPVIPTENSTYMTITRIMDMEDHYIREDQEYAEYFVCVDVSGTLEYQNVSLFVNGTAYPYELYPRTVAFYSEPTVSMDTIITNGFHSMSGDTEEEAIYWLVKEPEHYDVLGFTWNLETWGEDYTQYTGGDPLVVLDDSQAAQGIFKFVIDPDYVEYTRFNWKNFNLRIHMELDDNRDGEDNINVEYWDWDLWIEPAPQAEPKAHLRINDQTYQVFENGMIFRDFPTGDYDEWGNEIWGHEQCSLPEGVSYILEDNKLILDNAHLQYLELAYMDCWEDENGYHEEQRLPSENLNLAVYGENTIINDSSFAMMIRNGTNVTVSGTGSLYLYAENSPYNYNEGGDRYAYPTVAMDGGSSLNIGGNATVTAEVAGSGYHGEWPAEMQAIGGQANETLILEDSAVLTIVTPKGTRTLDESQENYGGARGIVNVSMEVNDNATLNTGTIYLWGGVDFTMNGGTVNLDPIGEIFYHPRLEDYYISRLGIYLENEDSVFTLNDGTINIDAEPDESDAEEFCLRTFQGINAPIGDVHINGGLIELYGNGNDGGSGIAVQCAWDENGPVEGLPTGNLYLNGGTVNIYADEGLEHEGIYTSALSEAVFSGGTVNASGSTHYIEGSVDWTGDTQLHGHTIVLDGAEILVKSGATLSVYNTVTVKPGGRIIVEDGGLLDVQDGMEIEGTVYIRSGGDVNYGPNHWIDGRITWEGESTAPYLTATWLDNYGEGWYMNDDFFEEAGLMSMDEHWRIFFLNTWDAENLVWKSEPVVPTVSSEYMTITRLVDMEDQQIRWDQEYAEYFVHANVFGTIDRQNVTLYVNGYSIPFEIYERHTGFFRTTEFTMDSLVQGHDFVLDPTAEENSLYWLVRDPVNYDVVYEEINYRTWNDEDYSDYITGEDLIVVDDSRKDEGIYKITVDPGFVDYVQYDFKNFEIQINMTLDHNGDDEIHEEHNNGGMWIQPPELKQPAAVLDINHTGYMIFDTGRIFRDVFAGRDEWGNEIWRREETSLPKGVSYVLDENKIILDNANLTTLELHPSASGYDEEGNFWEVVALPDENLTISLVGNSTIENHCGPAVMIEHGMNVTIEGNGSLYAKTTNYPDYRDENGNLSCSNTINVYGGSSLTIGGNATVTAELSGHGYWDNGEGATCHPISGSYDGVALEITDNATLTTVLPNGVRRYDESGYTSQIGGYVGIQNFNSVTVSGGTLNTDHLNFYDGGEFNLTGGTANFKDIGGVSLHYETGEPMYHYEGINMRNGTVNISGGELNIDVTARDGETVDNAGFYAISAVNGRIDISGGTVNINGNTDGWAILTDSEFDNNGPIDGTGSVLNISGGTININVPGRTYHGGILVTEISEGYLSGGTINDDYGVHRFFGNTYWDNTELTGIATNVYTHGPGSFYMSGGKIDLVGDSYEENGEIIRNRAIFETNAGGSIYGGEIQLTNGTYINNMNLTVDGGNITVDNSWPEVPGLENYLYFATSGGIMDITANGPAIVNGGTFHQMGGEITATNTSGTKPVMISTGATLQNSGVLNLNSAGGVGLYQGYDFELAGTENESMLFLGAVEDFQAPQLNINSQYGIYLNAPGIITGGANVNIHTQGEPINENMDWPIGIFVEKFTENEDGSGENVSGLIITGGANVNVVSEDTAGVDATSKGIVSVYSPVVIRGESEDDEPKVTIDAEMAVYSISDSPDETNFNKDITFFNASGMEVPFTSREFTETEEAGDYLHTLMDDQVISNVSLNEVLGGTCGENLTWTLDENGVLTISGTGEMADFYAGGGGYSIPWGPYEDMITKIVIQDGVTSISALAFAIRNEYDIEVIIPDSVTSLGARCFEGSNLTGITLPSSITTIPEGAFMNCLKLAEIHIPSGVTRIEDSAFENCDSLRTVEIPENVTYLGAGVFFYCDSLESVKFCGDAPAIAPEYVGAIFDRNMTAYYPAGNDTWNEDTLQDYNYETTTWIPYYPEGSTMSVDEFLAAVEEATAYNEFYMLSRTVIIDRDVELNGRGVMIGNGAEIIVKDGATLTSNLEIQVYKEGKLTVEAGGRMVNRNSFLIEGTVSISDDGDYAGFVHDPAFDTLVGVYSYGTAIPSVTGISKDLIYLQADCQTADQLSYIMTVCRDYAEHQILLSKDMVLNTMTIPENVIVSTAPGINITVAEGAFLTVNGSLTIRNSSLVVNGKLINNLDVSFRSMSELTVNGTIDNYGSIFISDDSIMTVKGTLNNLFDEETQNLGSINQQGNLTVDGTLYNEGILSVNGVATVNGSLTSQNTIDINQNGTLDLYGDLENNGSLRLNGANSRLTTYAGASLVNNVSVSNRCLGAVVTLADGTYTQSSTAELVQTYFEGGQITEINGAPDGTLGLMYEGNNPDTVLTVSEMVNQSSGYYRNCFLRVVGDMTIPAGMELNLTPGTYLVVLNNGDNYNGSLTVEGQIFNQSYIRLFGADMTISEGGKIANQGGTIETGMMMAEKPSVTVYGTLVNTSTGTVDLTNAEFHLAEGGVMQNYLMENNLGIVKNIPISDQTLFSEIIAGGEERLLNLISMVKNDGYRAGIIWISDTHITSSTVIPGNVSLFVQNGVTLTIDPGVIVQLDNAIDVDAGGTLVVDGILGVGGTVDVLGTMTVNGEVGTGNDATVTIGNSGVLNVTGYYGVNGGALDVQGTLNNNGTVSVTWTEERTGTVSGNVDPGKVSLWMPINERFPNHDEEDIAAMLAFAEANGYGETTVQFTTDYTFANDFTVPENMTLMIGAYQDDENYRAATVTLPSGLTLTVNGKIIIAEHSELVIEDGAEVICDHTFGSDGHCSNCGQAMDITVSITNVSASGKPKLSWNAISGAAQYEVHRATSKTGTYTFLSTVSDTGYTDTNAVAGTTYYYKVRAVAENGTKSNFSSIVSRACDLPRPTVQLSNVASSGKIKLTWDKIEGAKSYEVHRSTDGGVTYSLLKTTTSTSFTNTSTEAGVKYYYKVKALHSNSSANSAFSAEVNRTCDLPRPTLTIGNDAETGKITLSWEEVEAAIGYEVHRSEDGVLYELLAPADDGILTDTGLTDETSEAGTQYYYQVKALHSNSAADSAFSTAVSGICALEQPVLKATNVASTGKIKLSWVKIEGAAKYEVHRSTDGGKTYSKLGTASGTSYTNTSTDAGKTYYYKVMAVHESVAEANSTFSNVVSRTCDLPRPTVQISNIASSGKIKLTWNKIEGAESYKVYRSTDGGVTYSLLKTTTGTSLTNTTVEAGIQYYYKVLAVHESNSSANSAYSSVVSRVCALPAPVVTIGNDAETGKITLSWEEIEEAIGYEVYRYDEETEDYSLLTSTTGTDHADTTAEAGNSYSYKVLAVHSISDATSALSSEVSGICALAQPVLKATNVSSSGKIKLTWDKIEGAAKYEIYRATSKTGTYTRLSTSTGSSLTNTSAEAGKTYYYKIKAIHGSVAEANSAFSAVVSRACDLPRPTVKISNVASTGKIKLTWNEIEGAQSYKVYRSTDGSNYSLLSTVTGTSLTNTGAVAGSKYYYKVLAVHESNSSANSAYSSVVSAVCDLARPSVTVSNDTVTGQIELTWEAIEAAASYEVYRYDEETEDYSLLVSTSDTVLTDTDTVAGKEYSYKVLAVCESDAEANSALSSEVSGICALAQPVLKATNVSSSGKIKLTWDKIEGAAKYEIYRATSKTGTYTRLSTSTGSSLTNTSAEAGKTYYYKIKAIHGSVAEANSAFSAVVSRTCDLPRPTVKISNVASSGKIKLTWNEIEGAQSYKVYRSTDGSSYTLLKTTTGTSLTNTTVEPGIKYYYKVKAIHESTSSADSAYSSVVSAVCDLARPSVTVSTDAETGKVMLSWAAIDGAAMYEVYRLSGEEEDYSLLISTTDTGIMDTETEAGTEYSYKVLAVCESDAEANSAFSAVDSIVCALPAPALTVTLNSSGNPKLSWTKVAGAAKYEVYRSTNAEDWTLLKSTTGTSLTNTSVTEGTEYFYRVLAVHSDTSANSAYSSAVSIVAE